MEKGGKNAFVELSLARNEKTFDGNQSQEASKIACFLQ
jgi:hypothetical protein